jgi:AcrR family transcriptional regulator
MAMEHRSRRERHEDTRAAILAATREVLLDKGLDNLSLREVARRAGYSPASLYEYFDGKEALVTAVGAEALERLAAELLAVPTNQPPGARLVEIGLAYIRFAHRNPQHFLLIFDRLPSGRSSLAQAPDERSPYRLLLDAVQAALDAGAINARAGFGQEEIAYGLWALVHGMATLQLTHLRQYNADFAAGDRGVVEAFVRGLGPQ